MEKIKKHIANLKVAGKLKLYRMTVLVMTFFLVLVALISTVVIRSNIEKITEVWSPALEDLQELETMTAKYRIKQYQHLVESDDAVMTSCEEEIQKLESQIQDTDANLEAIMSADRDAQEGQDDYEVANAAWEEYRAASDEILKLSREGKQQEAAKLMIGEVYEEYKAFAEKLTTLRDKFQVELDRAKTMANVCTIIIFVVIVAAGLAIAVVTTLIGRIITNSITEPVEQIEAAVASLRKGELSNVEMLTYESEDELGGTIRNLKEAMGILADYVSEISVEVKAIAQGDLTRNGDDITDFLGDFSELKTSLLYILKRFNSTLTEIRNLAEQVSSNASEVENASKSVQQGRPDLAGRGSRRMYGPRYDHHLQARRLDLHAYHRIQIRHPGQPPARTGVPEQGHQPEPLRQAQGRRRQDPRRPLLFGRGPQGVRPVPRRHARHADHRPDHLPRHREERRSGGGGHAVQRFLLGERTLLCK